MFVGIDLEREPVPDETTICNFRRLMETHNPGDQLFHLVITYLQEKGLHIARGTIVDATIINAPSSTKNKDKQRDQDMHQKKRGNQWCLGMKPRIGVDSQTKLIHSVVATAANGHDSVFLGDLLHGDETRVWGASAYQGKRQMLADHAPWVKDFTNRRSSAHRPPIDRDLRINHTKSAVRARVEHIFRVMNRQFGIIKVRYKGLRESAHHLFLSCALVNIVMEKKMRRRQRHRHLKASCR